MDFEEQALIEVPEQARDAIAPLIIIIQNTRSERVIEQALRLAIAFGVAAEQARAARLDAYQTVLRSYR